VLYTQEKQKTGRTPQGRRERQIPEAESYAQPFSSSGERRRGQKACFRPPFPATDRE